MASKLAKRTPPVRRSSGPSPKAIQKAVARGGALARANLKKAETTGQLTTIAGAAAYGALKNRVNLPSPMGVGMDVWLGLAGVALPLVAPGMLRGKSGRMVQQALTGVGCLAAAKLAGGGSLAGDEFLAGGPTDLAGDEDDAVSGQYDGVYD